MFITGVSLRLVLLILTFTSLLLLLRVSVPFSPLLSVLFRRTLVRLNSPMRWIVVKVVPVLVVLIDRQTVFA